MKKYLLIIIGLVLLGAAIADTLTYGPASYLKNKRQILSGSTTGDPLYLFINEVDATFGGTESIDFLLFSQATEPSTPAAGQFYFDTASNTMKFANNSDTFVALASASGNSLDQSYDAGVAITVDNGAVALTATNAANNTALQVVQSDTGTALGIDINNAGSGNSIDIQGTSGFDIQGTDNSWSVSVAGLFDGEGLTGVTNSQGILFDVNNQISFADNSKDLIFDFGAPGSAIALLTTGSSIDEFNFGEIDDLAGINNIAFDGAVANTITQTGTGDTDDLTISQAGTVDCSLILSSAGSITDALSLLTTDAVGVLKISSSDILDIDAVDNVNIDISGAGANFDVDSAAGSVYLDGGEAAANAIVIDASNAAGGIDLDYGTGNFSIVGTGASADFSIDADLISIDGTGASNITFTNGADEDVTIATAGAADHSLIISATGTAADAMQITTSAGGMDITNGGASGEDLDIDGVLSAVTINSDEATTDSIDISSSLGGITMTSTAVASAWTHTATGAADDLTLSLAGAVNSSLHLLSAGVAADAITVAASAGGVDISAAATFDIDITATGGRILSVATEAVADQFKVDAQGVVAGDAINFETTDGGIMLNADGGTNGDIELNSADALIFTAAGAFTVDITGAGTYKGSWLPDSVVTTTETSTTLDTTDIGKITKVTADAQTITLPATVVGYVYTIFYDGADGGALITVELDNADAFLGCDIAGAAGEALLLTKVTSDKGDYVRLVGDGVDGWMVMEMNGAWAEASP